MNDNFELNLSVLKDNYHKGTLKPTEVVRQIYQRLREERSAATWIYINEEDVSLARAKSLEEKGNNLPLWGVPFAVKDNIDVKGIPTTAACPSYEYVPNQSATVVERLLAAGAILIGKTNLDQFATGLVGTRSPYGACENSFNSDYISGGSSSGSAVSVANGLVSFSLGTDTAGSGRVPAAFNNIVGLKPSRDCIPIDGVIPACKSLDCVSIFALTISDAEQVLQVCADSSDCNTTGVNSFTFGVPNTLEFFGDSYNETLFNDAVERLCILGGTPVRVDFTPFIEVGSLLYDGPWVAERYAAIESFFDADPEQLLPVTRSIIGSGKNFTAVDAFRASYRLSALKKQVKPVLEAIDMLVVPSVPSIYTIAELEGNPVELNTRLGYYTNFVNLLELCALSVPTAMRPDNLPFGVTLVARHGFDHVLAKVGDKLHCDSGLTLGALGSKHPKSNLLSEDNLQIAVVGAHLSGQPLNYQLADRGATLLYTTKTMPFYQLYALSDSSPEKPGLIRNPENGYEIEVEVWQMSPHSFGSFVSEVSSPLSIGTLLLEGGVEVKGFLCEPYALSEAFDISIYGGWKAYLDATSENKFNITSSKG